MSVQLHSTSQLHKQKRKQEQQALQPTAQESLVLLKNVIRMSLASIAYLRDIFHERNFVSSSIGGMLC
jgi:hypothetical protein